MGKAFELPKKSKCGDCSQPIHEGDLYTIIYEDDNSGKINRLQCDNCEVDDSIAEYRKTGLVGSHLSMDASMAHFYLTEGDLNRLRADVKHFYSKYKKDLLEIRDGLGKISDAIHAFEVKHWLPYLKKYWNDTDQRGHEAKVGGVKAMLWGCAGRVLITAERGKQSITMIFTDENSQVTPNGGQQGIDATIPESLSILKELVDAEKIKFKVSKSVKLAGL